MVIFLLSSTVVLAQQYTGSNVLRRDDPNRNEEVIKERAERVTVKPVPLELPDPKRKDGSYRRCGFPIRKSSQTLTARARVYHPRESCVRLIDYVGMPLHVEIVAQEVPSMTISLQERYGVTSAL